MAKSKLLLCWSLFATLVFTNSGAWADLADPPQEGPGMENQAAGMLGGLTVSTAQAQADMAAQQAICDNDPSGDACKTAQQRIAVDQAQIQQNQSLTKDLSSFVGSTGSSDPAPGEDQVALNLKKCATTLLASWCLYTGHPAYPTQLTAPPPPVVAVPIAAGPGKK